MKKSVKLNKTTVIAIIIVVLLAAAFGTALGIILADNKGNRDLYEQKKIRFVENGEEKGEYTLDEMLELCPSGEFKAIFKPNGMNPIERTYEGIELKSLLAALGISLEGKTRVTLKGSDGMEKPYTVAEVLEDGNVFIAFKTEGEDFRRGIGSVYPNEDGGPYVIIKASDQYSNNRVKLLTEVNVE